MAPKLQRFSESITGMRSDVFAGLRAALLRDSNILTGRAESHCVTDRSTNLPMGGVSNHSLQIDLLP